MKYEKVLRIHQVTLPSMCDTLGLSSSKTKLGVVAQACDLRATGSQRQEDQKFNVILS